MMLKEQGFMKKILLIVCVLLGSASYAQNDPVYSQRIHNPVSYNPANAGMFNGTLRGTGTFRRQWEGISNISYQTMAVNADFPLVHDPFGSDDFIGMGINVESDQAGQSAFQQLNANLAFSYVRPMDQYNWISVGFQAGYSQKSLSTAGLNWADTWTTVGFDPTIGTAEVFTNESSNYLDFGAGINFYRHSRSGAKAFAGYSMYHASEPSVNFLGSDDIISRLHVVSGGVLIGNKKKDVYFFPNVIWQTQSSITTITYGMDLKFMLGGATTHTGYLTESSLSLGVYHRWDDALIPTLRIQKGGFDLGVSFDVNIGDITRINGGMGGPEFRLAYRAGYKKGSRNKGKKTFTSFM